jgi:hypothetical protein
MSLCFRALLYTMLNPSALMGLSAIVWLFTDESYKPSKMQHSGSKSRHMCKAFSCNVSCLGLSSNYCVEPHVGRHQVAAIVQLLFAFHPLHPVGAPLEQRVSILTCGLRHLEDLVLMQGWPWPPPMQLSLPL